MCGKEQAKKKKPKKEKEKPNGMRSQNTKCLMKMKLKTIPMMITKNTKKKKIIRWLDKFFFLFCIQA